MNNAPSQTSTRGHGVIIGLSAFYHDSACCVLRDGQLIAAASEERFTRVKGDARLPVQAFNFCLNQAGVGLAEVDRIAYYESPVLKLGRQLWSGLPAGAGSNFSWLDAGRSERLIRERLGFDGPIDIHRHHLSHAASSFYFSGFEDAAVMVVDGVGEWATTSYGEGTGDHLALFDEVCFPHSLGLFYAAITAYLGFRVNSGEYKVMGLAPYGQPKYVDALYKVIQNEAGGSFRLDLRYFDFISGTRMFGDALCTLLGEPPREPESELRQFHKDVARSTQTVLEEILLSKVAWLAERVPSRNLCMAGGVALNCVANGRILRESAFERLFVQPAAGDAGGCLGAAVLSYQQQTGIRPSREPLRKVFLGPSFDEDHAASLLSAAGLTFQRYQNCRADFLASVVDALAENKIVGWFQGAMEFGPRALGARSILANPADPDMRERLNNRIKKREGFRPFAPVVTAEAAADYFELEQESPFMLQVCQVKVDDLPAITHVNGSARPQTVTKEQNPKLHALICAFKERTGIPVLVNTSFNVRGEPIVCTPEDALFCMGIADLDVLAIGDCLVYREDLPKNWPELFALWRPVKRGKRTGHRDVLYTFV